MNSNSIKDFIKDKYVYILTIALAFGMMLGAWIIGKIGPFGGRCLIVVDGVHQYLPFFSEYQDKLKHINDIQYTFDIGMGNNFLSLWSYYLSSPFSFIILFFSKAHLPMAINIIISLKIIVSAFTFAYMLVHWTGKPNKNIGVVPFALLYAFSSYVVGYYWNLMWLDCILIFPLIMLGMQKLHNEGKSKMYILALLYGFICNYYISFMICMFLIIWFFTLSYKDVNDFVLKGIKFAISSLVAAAMGAVVLLPAYKGIMTTASAEFEFPKWEFYGKFADTLRSHMFCSEVLTNQIGDAGTNLYCGIITILFAIMFFFIRDISLAKKIIYAIIEIMFIISFNNVKLNYIWHGFHNQYGIPNRFAFLYVFILLLMAYEVYLKREQLILPMVLISYTLSMLFVIYCYFNAEVTYENKCYIITAALLTMYLVFMGVYCQVKVKREFFATLLLVTAIFEMAVNGLYGFYQDGSSDMEYYYGNTAEIFEVRDRVESKEMLSRSDILQPISVDEATWYNLKSLGIFCSTVNGDMVDVMGDLGFYTGANEYLYYGATPVTNSLFGVKHVYTRQHDFVNVDTDMTVCDTGKTKDGEVTVYENPDALSIGYMVNDDILGFQTYDNGPFTVQNELCGALTGIEPVFVSIFDDMNVSVYGTNMDLTLVDDNNATYKKANGSARGDMIYTVPEDMDLYISCRGSNVHKVALLIDGKERAYDRYQGQVFHVGEMKKGQLVDIQFELNDGQDMSGELYCYPMKFLKSEFDKVYENLSQRQMKIISATDTVIKGTVEAGEDEVFFTSIPYEDGWKIYANGKEVDTMSLVGGLLGAKLPAGEVNVVLKYQSPGLMKGLVITIIGIILFIIIMIKEEREDEVLPVSDVSESTEL
ncbi:MAG: YfhO family protein [Lachnospiraceae bacterium]|nr:YfhO family protein [Lachnospiraceae bacterium]